jgi:hypothetical protein
MSDGPKRCPVCAQERLKCYLKDRDAYVCEACGHKWMWGRGAQYNFVDMTGKVIGHLTVVSRAANVAGVAQWKCQCDCGGTITRPGIALRAKITAGTAHLQRCKACRPKRAAQVTRRAVGTR